IGALVTLLGYVNQFTSVFHDVAWQYTQIIQYNTDVQTAMNIEKAFAEQHRSDIQAELPENWQTIRFRGLNFSHRDSYDGRYGPQSLHEINIALHKGKKIAMIGESGSGKSTLLALMRGLYEPEPGLEMQVDGKDYSFGTLNQTVTLFPQEPEIFESTIAYNLTLGLPFPEAELDEVCSCAHFTEVILQLPRGLESNIQEKGVNLSGGQRQRLALARGILAAKESDVVLLDEPTSSVDPKTESMIYENLFRMFSQKAMVSSLHRLHLLPLFDYIYVLDKGSIVAEGQFEDLRHSSEAFRALWKHQEEVAKKAVN
ncbi:MAG: ATP-binding cassette domain-containing protein, partial [Chitinophagales bacterium]